MIDVLSVLWKWIFLFVWICLQISIFRNKTERFRAHIKSGTILIKLDLIYKLYCACNNNLKLFVLITCSITLDNEHLSLFYSAHIINKQLKWECYVTKVLPNYKINEWVYNHKKKLKLTTIYQLLSYILDMDIYLQLATCEQKNWRSRIVLAKQTTATETKANLVDSWSWIRNPY